VKNEEHENKTVKRKQPMGPLLPQDWIAHNDDSSESEEDDTQSLPHKRRRIEEEKVLPSTNNEVKIHQKKIVFYRLISLLN
jgi:hypothetical protein